MNPPPPFILYSMPITLNDLKKKAISAGYNLKGEKFELRDWPFVKAYLLFNLGIDADYSEIIRDTTSSANSVFDPHFSFESKNDVRPVAGEYTYGTILVHAGVNLGISEEVNIESQATVEVFLDGKWTEVKTFSVEYTTQDIEIPFRFNPAQTGNSIKFVSPTFTSIYLFNAIPFESKDETPAICGEAVCGLTIVGDIE